jgi:cathepsin C
MMEARVRVKTQNADQRILSTQEVLACSDYSQKCDGGFPFLVAKVHEIYFTNNS